MCGGGGDGGGGEGGLGRKASRQLISAPLSSLKGSGLLCRGALGSPRAALGSHGDSVSSGCPAKWHWCHDSATSCSAQRHGMAMSQFPMGARQGGRSRESQNVSLPGPGMLGGQEKQVGWYLCRKVSLRQVFKNNM